MFGGGFFADGQKLPSVKDVGCISAQYGGF
jgi:hypothetical protein